jgi:N-hydroxyarylamine O-acetyltransferase
MNGYLDVPAYFARIGYDGPSEPTLALLHALCARHPSQIPFESLDPFLGIPVDLDPAALQAKLIGARRGGYCQEHNSVFHDVLATLGFTVTALAARVVWSFKGQAAPLTHRLTRVDLPEGRFIADVGFGGNTPTAPLRLEPGIEQTTPHGTYRLAFEREFMELQLRLNDCWEAMYRFTLAPQTRVDFEVANWYTSTNPHSLFTQNLIVCRVVDSTRVNLRNSSLAIRQPDGRAEQHVLAGATDLQRVLEDVMDLALPVGADAIWAKMVSSPS